MGYVLIQMQTGCDLVTGVVGKMGEVTRLRDYLLHTIKSHALHRERTCPTWPTSVTCLTWCGAAHMLMAFVLARPFRSR